MSIILDWLVPSRRHREEEQHRLEWTRDETGQGDPHRGPIDLDSGVVTIKASPASDAGASEGASSDTASSDTASQVADPASDASGADLSEPTKP